MRLLWTGGRRHVLRVLETLKGAVLIEWQRGQSAVSGAFEPAAIYKQRTVPLQQITQPSSSKTS